MTQPFETQLASSLQNAQSHDKNTREQAENFLRQIEEENWIAFIQGLTLELCNESKSADGRQMAGLLLKNALDAKDSQMQSAKAQKWQEADDGAKKQIREQLLNALASQVEQAGYGAAMAISKVARIDLLAGQWPDLLERIHTYVAPNSPEATREHALQCLGLICEEHVESASEFPQSETNRILTALVGGMSGNQTDRIRLAATRALFDAIEFASANFDKENERNYLMQTMCEAMICPNNKIRLAAYQNVNKVLELHYQYLERYIEALYGLTTGAFSDASEEVAMQAIEFWSTLAEIEQMYNQEDEENGYSSGHPQSESKHFMDRCAQQLVPMVLQLLLQQQEDQDNDDTLWNKCMSATVCLINIVRCVRDQVSGMLQEFVRANVRKQQSPEDWRSREAALTAFGCLVDGPDRAALLPFVQEAFEFMIQQGLTDEHAMVRRTTLWTLGRIFEYLHTPDAHPQLVNKGNVGALVAALISAMGSDALMATKACYAVQALAGGFKPTDESHALSPYFAQLAEELLKVAYANVPADQSAALHITAFEAMHTLISSSAHESLPLVTQMVPHFLGLIDKSMAAAADADANIERKRGELQSQLCAALQVAIKRACQNPAAKQTVLSECADNVLACLLRLQVMKQAVNDEVVLTMDVLCQEMGSAFGRYLNDVMPVLMHGLARHQDLGVCRICINTVGDIAREVTTGLDSFADQIMKQLLANLQSQQLNRDVKPDILQVFGDMAQGLGAGFDRYIKDVVETLQAAMNIAYTNQVSYGNTNPEPDDPLVTYNNELRGAILVAAEGILVSLPNDPSQFPPQTAQIISPFGLNLLRFIHLVHQDSEYADEPLNKSCVGLLGDLCGIPGVAQEITGKPENQQWIQQFLSDNAHIEQRVLAYARQRLESLPRA